ncbi:MAG: peptidoglycan DD-metalloendopeptidase family protein [Acidocella sp.]|nr:peptidoglycan DD-metalloendopeptidase family protein [Acidocella sp.]
MQKAAVLLLMLLAPVAALADPTSTAKAQAALQAAQQAQAAHEAAAAAAHAKQAADAAKAAQLAEAQIQAAIQLRRLEEQTGGAAQTYADLQTRQQQAADSLKQNAASLAALLPVMQRISAQPAATLLANPARPEDSVRGIIILQGIAADIQRRAAAVQAETQTVTHLIGMMSDQQKLLIAAVTNQQQAEDALTAQIAAAKTAETADADTEAAENAAAIAADADVRNLTAVLAKITTATPDNSQGVSGVTPSIAGNAPVAGRIIQSFGANSIAGPATGITYSAAPGARVVAPCTGGVQFADAFQSYGELVILDCGQSNLFVLSGMAKLDVSAGQHVARGQPVGEMAPFDPKNPARQPQLYVELRQNGTPVNPNSR